MKNPKINTRQERGQALIEFALTALLFLGLLLGIIEFGRYWYYSTHLGNSVRAAARYGAVLPDPTNDITGRIEEYARTEITTYLPEEGLAPDAVEAHTYDQEGILKDDTANHGWRISVSARYDFRILAGTIIPAFSGAIPLSRTASINYE